jgi:hypothetical protein
MLTYNGLVAALRLESGLPFHVKMARSLDATREEIINTIIVGLPLYHPLDAVGLDSTGGARFRFARFESRVFT